MIVLSRLLLQQRAEETPSTRVAGRIAEMGRREFDELTALASSNHVIIRGLNLVLRAMQEAQDDIRAEWAATALAAERARIANAMTFLHVICAAFEEEGHNVTVIKSLDHWPDLGSDLDLFTNAAPEVVLELMQRHFQARILERSWGDRLAQKWNFAIPGLPEAVEIHMGRLGQTGEQTLIASTLLGRTRQVRVGEFTFRVPSASDRLMISTLQRMYRHFYFRLCDIVDSAALVESGAVDFDDLRHSSQAAGIWEGVATYLAIVSDYVKQYRGVGLDLPPQVTAAARFGGAEVYYAREFLRVPIMPQSANLYRAQFGGLLRRRELHSSARLGLLPWLATAALIAQKMTGSDKGIW